MMSDMAVFYHTPTLLTSTTPVEHKIHSTTYKWNGVDHPSLEAVTAAMQGTPCVPPAEEAKEDEKKETDAEKVVKTRAVAPKKGVCCA